MEQVRRAKQILIIRKDLNMRKGKIAAQAAHASMMFMKKMPAYVREAGISPLPSFAAAVDWLDDGLSTKICVYVNSEKELRAVVDAAIDAQLLAHIVIDQGLTEFGGKPTATAAAIGPAYEDQLQHITGHLPLL